MQSAALGLAIAGALSMGYANIFVTAPSPENLKTLFEFTVVGLEQMEYKVRCTCCLSCYTMLVWQAMLMSCQSHAV